MSKLDKIDSLRRLYGYAKGRAVSKQMSRLDKYSRKFIKLSPFLVMATSRDEGLADASPKGDHPGFVHVIDNYTIAIPDRPGNNRLDSMENIILNPAIGLIFFIPGLDETLRINGSAEIRDDLELLKRFVVEDRLPKAVFVVSIKEVYIHCAKALMRSNLWSPNAQHKKRPIPTIGQIIKEQSGDNDPVNTQEEMEAAYKKVLY